MSKLLAGGANLDPGEVLRRNVLQRSRYRRGDAAQPTARDAYSRIFQCATSRSRFIIPIAATDSRRGRPHRNMRFGVTRTLFYASFRRISLSSSSETKRYGRIDLICGLAADHFYPSELLSLPFTEPFLSYRPHVKRIPIGWSSRMTIGTWQNTCFWSGICNASVGKYVSFATELVDAGCSTLCVSVPSIYFCNVLRHTGVRV